MERQNLIKDFAEKINKNDAIGILYENGERCMVGAVGERYTLFRLTIVGPCADPKSYYSKKSLLINIAQEEADIIADMFIFHNYRQMYKWAIREDSTFNILIRNILGETHFRMYLSKGY